MSNTAHPDREALAAGLREGLGRSGAELRTTDDLPGTLGLVLRGLTAKDLQAETWYTL